MKERNPRILLARLREGDYAHPGDTEAIDIFLEHLTLFQHPNFEYILDVGCGRGGTAEYIRQKMLPLLINGIDIDTQTIKYAKDNYPNVVFNNCDINVIDQITDQKFDLIYFFSVLYALERSSQQEIFNKLAHIARPGAIIAISDYVILADDMHPIIDFANKPMCPPPINDLKTWLSQSGWEIIGEFDLWDKYQIWYSNFIRKLNASQESLLLEFDDETINIVRSTFQTILNKIKDKIWNGSLIYAKLNRQTFFQSESSDENVQDRFQLHGLDKTA